VQATLRVRDLVITSWETSRENVVSVLPEGLEAAEVDGRLLVSIVAFRVETGRVGRLPVLPFNQLNARTYVTWEGEPAVFFVASRVTTGGLLGRLLGAPYRQARLRVAPGSVSAPGLGVSLSFRPAGDAEPGPLGRHELGLFEHHGLRSFRIRRGEAEWSKAELIEPARADFLLGVGLPPRGEPELLYTPEAVFEAEMPQKLEGATRRRPLERTG
jgi:Uncharacterized conserved protein (COG2071)